MRVTREESSRLARRNAVAARQNAKPIATSSAEVTQNQIIRDNIAKWHRDRQQRQSRIEEEIRHRRASSEHKSFTRKFGSVSEAFTGKRVFV